MIFGFFKTYDDDDDGITHGFCVGSVDHTMHGGILGIVSVDR